MKRQHEYQRRYHPNTGRYELTHIYEGTLKSGEGIYSSLKDRVMRLIRSKTPKDITKKVAKKAINTTSDYAEQMAGDKIVKLLQEKSKNISPNVPGLIEDNSYNNALAVQQLLAGSGIKRRR